MHNGWPIRPIPIETLYESLIFCPLYDGGKSDGSLWEYITK